MDVKKYNDRRFIIIPLELSFSLFEHHYSAFVWCIHGNGHANIKKFKNCKALFRFIKRDKINAILAKPKELRYFKMLQ